MATKKEKVEVQVKLVSFGKGRNTAQIIVKKGDAAPVTRHVKRDSDGKYHWIRPEFNAKTGKHYVAHETYVLGL